MFIIGLGESMNFLEIIGLISLLILVSAAAGWLIGFVEIHVTKE